MTGHKIVVSSAKEDDCFKLLCFSFIRKIPQANGNLCCFDIFKLKLLSLVSESTATLDGVETATHIFSRQHCPKDFSLCIREAIIMAIVLMILNTKMMVREESNDDERSDHQTADHRDLIVASKECRCLPMAL